MNYTQNLKEAAKNCWIHNREGVLGKFSHHRATQIGEGSSPPMG